MFYTAPLLDLASSWHYHDLTLYVNDGAIYVVSATKQAATKAALEGYKVVTTWLHMNGLEADPAKTELMTFTPTRRSNLTGSNIQGTQPTPDHNITMTRSLRYLGIFITDNLDWSLHVKTMANRTKSTIRGISILGNSVHRLDFLH